MSTTVLATKDHLSAMLHGGSLKRVRNIYSAFERAANNLMAVIHPIDSMRDQPLSNTVHDDVYNYSLPSDFREIIDLYPQNERNSRDSAGRKYATHFDLRKALTTKEVSIESKNASKFLKVNWRSNSPTTVHAMNDIDDNGTWGATGGTTNIKQDTITKYTGLGSVRFNIAANDDGIQCNDMSEVDLDDEDEAGDFFLWFYIKDSTDLAKVTSVTLQWGNTLTTQLWLGVAQTAQADETAFKVGWNLIRVPWSTATETGTVDPESIDSVKITFQVSGAISDIRVDNITCSRGRGFDIKYYSKYLFKNSAGSWIGKPTADDDNLVLDQDALNIFLYFLLMETAHQVEGSDSTFDIGYAEGKLGMANGRVMKGGLISQYNSMYPSQVKKIVANYGGGPARGRW